MEKKEGVLEIEDGKSVRVIDLPGTYSLTAYSQEELVARNFIVDQRPNVVVDIINTGALERNLYLAVQFMELGVPVILALNMIDEVRKRNITIDSARLAKLMNVPVIETVARTGAGKKGTPRESGRSGGKTA
ncbi:Ferrous iron transport protein B [Desulfosporosinus metallidurans]|uniref:Ferrous iron transport protein B n=1 Tax=Desulfosporosinus metallidurans TaxID=1888891 RepID=A0A1Q8QB70_9FIRM|nr:Ferrous iron transport protein B [Desulfosporosinus metallidurans]